MTFVDAGGATDQLERTSERTPSIAIVMPAFNEADRIADTFGAIATYLVRTGRTLPIFLADDGSTDRTTGVAWATADRLGLDLTILRMPHRGKALTVRDAMLAVSGRVEADLLMMLDADNEITIDQLEHVVWSDDPRTVYIARRVAEAHGALGATPTLVRRLMSTGMRLAARDPPGAPVHGHPVRVQAVPAIPGVRAFLTAAVDGLGLRRGAPRDRAWLRAADPGGSGGLATARRESSRDERGGDERRRSADDRRAPLDRSISASRPTRRVDAAGQRLSPPRRARALRITMRPPTRLMARWRLRAQRPEPDPVLFSGA